MIAAALACGLATTPANAGGSVSVHVTPDAKGARAIEKGLRLYSILRSVRNEVRVDQRGRGNVAGIGQSGRGNTGLIVQRGRDHTATLDQNGNDNAFAILQFGRRRSAEVVQNGNGGSGILLQGGW
jgi:major curlin subunit